ncbi:helix-turn-helix domain-containing protein [Enterococcus sp. OL5]|uniref:helix-turn-helix domain-containing protein n=1 Tax=Enterococcus sp. OL5 TaxID=2590214 RepID=UPI00112EEE5D|nr:helix-turn-helix domain-containing protein [Enterococcus sp. OL5]TPR55269.1 HTH domain-containing protein [Enterococcus sp. OL5]
MNSLTFQLVTSSVNRRSLILLAHMENEHVLSVKQLSEKASISRRTVLTDLKAIRAFFGNTISLNGTHQGMKLVINDHDEYDKKRRSYYEKEPLILLVQAFYAGQTFPFLAWIRAMHISESTANRLLKKLQMILDDYELVVTKSSIGLVGEEINQRKFFWDFYCETHYFDLPPIDHQLQEALILRIEQEVDIISKKKVISIIRLSFQRSTYGTLTFDSEIKALAQQDPLYLAINETIQESGSLQTIARNRISEEACFIYLMLYAQWTLRGKTRIPLSSILTKSTHFNQLFVHFLELHHSYLEKPCSNQQIVEDFLVRQYAKVGLAPTFLKNSDSTNHFVCSLPFNLYEPLIAFMEVNAIPHYFENRFFSDFCCSFVLYLFGNQLIRISRKIVVLLANNYVIDEWICSIFEHHFSGRMEVLYEEQLSFKQINQLDCDTLITNIVPFEYTIEKQPQIFFLPKYIGYKETIKIVVSILNEELKDFFCV